MKEVKELRTRNSKTHQDEVNPNRYTLDAVIGALHYRKDGSWEDIDTTIEAATSPWNYQMVRADYTARFLSTFSSGQIAEFRQGDHYVRFQPMALQWSNDLNQIQQIATPATVTASVSGNRIAWAGAYGTGIDWAWECVNTRLCKILTVDKLSRLGTPASYIISGGNPVLELNIIFANSETLSPSVDGQEWDRTTQKYTMSIIEWNLSGETVFGFMPLRCWDSKGDGTIATMRLRKSGNSQYMSVRLPYSWLQAATFPVYIDTDVDIQIATGTDDGTTGSWYSATTTDLYVGKVNSSTLMHSWYRFPGITASGTVDTAYLSLRENSSGGNPQTLIYGCKEDNPSYPTNDADFDSRTRTTANVAWNGDPGDNGYHNSPEIKTICQELLDNFTYNNDAMMFFHQDNGNTDGNYEKSTSYENGGLSAKFHMEYTTGIQDLYRTGITNIGLLGDKGITLLLDRGDIAYVGLASTGSRITERLEIILAYLGMLPLSSKLFEFMKSSIIYIGINNVGDRLINVTRNQSQQLGLLNNSSRIYQLIRGGIQYLGLTSIYSRALQLARVNLSLLGLLSISSRQVDVLRSDLVLLGLHGLAEHFSSYIENGIAQLGMLTSIGNRSLELIRDNIQHIGLLSNFSRIIEIIRLGGITIGLFALAERTIGEYLLNIFRTGTIYLGLLSDKSRLLLLDRGISSQLGMTNNGSRIVDRLRSTSIQIGLISSYTSDLLRLRSGHINIGLSSNSSRSIVIIRDIVALLGLSASSTYSRIAGFIIRIISRKQQAYLLESSINPYVTITTRIDSIIV